jgi:hypothetical protein
VKFESFELREFEVLFVSGAALLIEFSDVAVQGDTGQQEDR